jgi:nucleoside-diphosphate-sugar epimerase
MPIIQNFLITGGTGYIGKSILDYLSNQQGDKQPQQIFLVSRSDLSSDLPKNLNIKWIKRDLENPWEFGELPSNLDVIHLAADGSPTAYSEESTRKYLQITSNLSTWIRNNDFRSIFFASSGACSTYKPLPSTPVDTKKEIFREGRIEAENIFINSVLQSGVPYSIGRLYTFIGMRILDKAQYAVSEFIHSAVNKREVVIRSNPNTVRSYLSESDMANWILSSVRKNHPLNRIEVGSKKSVTIYELASKICDLTEATLKIEVQNDFGDVYLPENDETCASLGVKEEISWDYSLSEVVNYLLGVEK